MLSGRHCRCHFFHPIKQQISPSFKLNSWNVNIDVSFINLSSKMCLWRVCIKQARQSVPLIYFGKLSLSYIHKHEGNLCVKLSVIVAFGKKSQIPALRQCNQAHSEVTFRSRPQSLPQSSHPEYTNQHAVFQCQLMGLSQIIAQGIRLGNGKGKATNNNKCYLSFD